MSSHYAKTRPTSASSRTEPAPRSGGLQASTLIAAAIASVVAATVVSKLWAPGTVMATAMTPVLIALVKEAVERPARRMSSMATRSGVAPLSRTARSVAPPPPEADAPPPPVAGAEYSQMRVYRRERAATGRRWKLAVATGLLACLIAIAAMTLPELVAGRSIVSSSHHTTIFGGHRSTSSSGTSTSKDKTTTGEDKTTSTSTDQQDTTTSTTTAPETTTTAPQPAVPQQTQTTPPTQTQPAPEQSRPPAQTQPAPQQTTPAPTP